MSCWFWNINASYRGLFWSEIQAGRLRQGWGYREELDLRTLKAKRDGGGVLEAWEQVAWDRCKHMLERISEGDLVVVKNVPNHGSFVILEVLPGGYRYEPSPTDDFQHCLPCKIAAGPFEKNWEIVPAPLVAALDREQNPIRVTYKHSATVVALSKEEVGDPESQRANTLRESVTDWRSQLAGHLKELLRNRLRHRSTEELVGLLLRKHFGDDVRWTAGPSEKGADFIAEVSTGLGQTVRLAIQVKMHWGADWDLQGLQQLEQAFVEHQVQQGLLVSMADEMGDNVRAKLKELEKRYDVRILHGDELYERLLELISDQDLDLEQPV